MFTALDTNVRRSVLSVLGLQGWCLIKYFTSSLLPPPLRNSVVRHKENPVSGSHDVNRTQKAHFFHKTLWSNNLGAGGFSVYYSYLLRGCLRPCHLSPRPHTRNSYFSRFQMLGRERRLSATRFSAFWCMCYPSCYRGYNLAMKRLVAGKEQSPENSDWGLCRGGRVGRRKLGSASVLVKIDFV